MTKILLFIVLYLSLFAFTVRSVKAEALLVGPYSYVETSTHQDNGLAIAQFPVIDPSHVYTISIANSTGIYGDWWCLSLTDAIPLDEWNSPGPGHANIFCKIVGGSYSYVFGPGHVTTALPTKYISIETGYTTSAQVSGIQLYDNTTSSYIDFGPITSPTPLPTQTPIPTEAPTPTPVPTPSPSPTPIPVTKIVFIPGFGASWNANAFANCTFDPNPNDWSLASYAENVYSPILSALGQSGWDTIPFYYDWRAQVPLNSFALANKLNTDTINGEKVNIVGHSMGGLVATDYLVHQNGNVKTNSLLTVGSPLKGALQSYPSWSGGEIWEDNFITKVAMNLYLLHCGSLVSGARTVIQSQFPSVQNMLPVFDYLKNGSKMKSWSSMYARNNWLPLSIDPNYWGIKFGTLTGTGFSTLSQIQVKDAAKKDLLLDNQLWRDGKPTGKVYSLNGDGTVLLSSSIIDSAHNVTINQTHSGLVNSISGMTEILKFLGSSPTSLNSPNTAESNSSLVIIGYPSNFWITDQYGSIKKDKNGMLALMNPKSGNYRLNLLPNSPSTLFVVAQFLPNGDIKYKEYNFKGFAPQLKTLKFSLENPQQDILN